MHRIWVGVNSQLVMAGLGTFLACLALVIHVWAYSITGWPKYKKAEYAAKIPPASVR
jgi:hypothetical protein